MVTPVRKETPTITSTSSHSHLKRQRTSGESTTSSIESSVTDVTSGFFSKVSSRPLSPSSSDSRSHSPFPSSDPILASSSKKQRKSHETSSTRSSSPPTFSCSSSFTGHLDLVPPRSNKPQILASGHFIPHASESPFSPLSQSSHPFSTFAGCGSLSTSRSDTSNKPQLADRHVLQAHNLSLPEEEIRKTKAAFIKMAFNISSQHPDALHFMRSALLFSLSFVEKNSLLRKLAHLLGESAISQDKEEAIKMYYDLIDEEYAAVLPLGKRNWDTNIEFYAQPYFKLARLLTAKQTPEATAEAIRIYDSLRNKEFTTQLKVKAALQQCDLLKKRKASCDLDQAISIYYDALSLMKEDKKDENSALAIRLHKELGSALLQRDGQTDRPMAIQNLHIALEIRDRATASSSESSWADIAKLLLKTLS